MTNAHLDGRLRELAAEMARLKHDERYDGHQPNDFAACPHPDCVLVRAAVPVEEAAPTPKEVCICAAIQMDNGVILRGHRHDDCFNTAQKYGYKERITQAKQGFVTSRNRFVGREEGAQLQQAAGIVSAHTGTFTDFLFSEDLYFNDNAAAASPGPVAGAVPAPQWRDIENAPKDEQRVVLFNPDESMGSWAIQTGAFYERLGGWQYDGQIPRYSNAHQPTHWMPLPSPPRSEQDETP